MPCKVIFCWTCLRPWTALSLSLSNFHSTCVFVSRLDRESDMAALLEATRPALKDVLGKVYSMSRDQVYMSPLNF